MLDALTVKPESGLLNNRVVVWEGGGGWVRRNKFKDSRNGDAILCTTETFLLNAAYLS